MTERRSIMAAYARDTRKIDQLHAATERTIKLVKERRSALIAAPVAGHLAAEDRDGDIRESEGWREVMRTVDVDEAKTHPTATAARRAEAG